MQFIPQVGQDREFVRPSNYQSDWLTATYLINFEFLPAAVLAYKAAAQNIPTGALTPLVFDTESFGNGLIHNITTNPTRFTAQFNGWYYIGCQVRYEVDATGTFRALTVNKNGAVIAPAQPIDVRAPGLAGGTPCAVAQLVYLKATDYIEFTTIHDAGGALNTNPDCTYAYVLLVKVTP